MTNVKIRKKHDLDARVAQDLGLDPKKVKDVTRAFLEAVRDSLVDLEEVHIDGFGKFRVVLQVGRSHPAILRNAVNGDPKRTRHSLQVNRRFRVHFSRAAAFKRVVREKFGPGAEKT